MKPAKVNHKATSFALCAILVSSFSCVAPTYAIDGKIDESTIKVWDNRDFKNLPPGYVDRKNKEGDTTQPVTGFTDEGIIPFEQVPVAAKRTSAPNISCNSPDASNNLVLSPPDAPGVRTDQRTGQTYLCTPKTPEGQDPAPVEYVLPDGEVIEAPAPIVVTAEDFRNLGILPSTAHQERAPHTLKNYNTNFWASPQEQTFDIEMGGVPVQVRATPVSYRFDYGDGESLNTINAGYQLGEEVWDEPTPTSHKYVQPGDYTYSVATFYRGEFSVAGGPWQVIDGTGEAVSEGQLVRVWRTQVGLVADDCSADGGAWGCPGADR